MPRLLSDRETTDTPRTGDSRNTPAVMSRRGPYCDYEEDTGGTWLDAQLVSVCGVRAGTGETAGCAHLADQLLPERRHEHGGRGAVGTGSAA